MVRINRVYTKTGDRGETRLIGGDKVSKASIRIDCYGTVDELNATLGLVQVALQKAPACAELSPVIIRVQNELFNLGAQLATPDPERRAKMPDLREEHTVRLERECDDFNEGLPELRSFVLPGGTQVAAALHLSRTVCRRAERLVVALSESEHVGAVHLTYLNRLSDALFIFSRWAVAQEGADEPLWEPE